ncbi:MAG: hypothetical protein JOZ95_20350, partial [Solirubrobacterales bacterium]|nr:hypothetical protein [Solirubrobacterales bacterium]
MNEFGCAGSIDAGKEIGVQVRLRGWACVIAAVVLGLNLLLVGGSLARVARKPTALPHMGRPPSPSIFGINTLTYDSSQARFKRDIPTAARLGARWVHFTNGSV